MNPSGTPNGAFTASPIADRTYRNYDGPVRTRALRWWIVALSVIRTVFHKPVFWILCIAAMFPYVGAGVGIEMGTMMSGAGGQAQSLPYVWQFYSALQGQDFMLFFIALVVGTDCIAGDLRANALMMYLSKPITKGDYLFGKWIGVFLPLYVVSIAPAALIYSFSALGLFGGGFLKAEPALIWRLIIATAIPAVVHASLLVGFSAWSTSGRIAGAAYAGLCLFTYLVASIFGDLQLRFHHVSGLLVVHLSVFGAANGLAQVVYNAHEPGSPFSSPPPALPHAFFWEMLGLCVLLSGLGIMAARARINAVEVVRG
ncbi:MAG: ABC transporter permease [Capsulimonadaceae bacterium]